MVFVEFVSASNVENVYRLDMTAQEADKLSRDLKTALRPAFILVDDLEDET